MPIDVMVKEATGLPDKYVDMVVSYIHFLQYQLKSEDDSIHSSGKRELGILADRFYNDRIIYPYSRKVFVIKIKVGRIVINALLRRPRIYGRAGRYHPVFYRLRLDCIRVFTI